MVVAEIKGGLGNQMFQWAAAAALGRHLSQEVRLDPEWFRHIKECDTPREYSLLCFPGGASAVVNMHFHYWLMHSRFIPLRGARMIARLLKINFEKCIYGQIIVENYDRWREITEKPRSRNYYLRGYWQSEKYFTNHRKYIKDMFTFPDFTDPHNVELHKTLCSACNTVSVHIRRGDYVSNLNAMAVHGGVCGVDYYERAISIIVGKLSNPLFVVFSDDIAWARKNIHFPSKCIFVEWNQSAAPHVDMQLMSLCRHHIIANSSYSWWGAWLGENADSIIIRPAHWFADAEMELHYGRQIPPERWIAL